MHEQKINVNDLPPDEQDKFHDDFARWIEEEFNGDSSEAEDVLADGVPIYYRDENYPGETIREYPDGRREIVKVILSEDNTSYEIVVVRSV